MDPELLVLELNLHAQESHRWAIRGHPVWCSDLPLLFHSGAKSLKHLLLTNGQDVVHICDEKTNGLATSHRRSDFPFLGTPAALHWGTLSDAARLRWGLANRHNLPDVLVVGLLSLVDATVLMPSKVSKALIPKLSPFLRRGGESIQCFLHQPKCIRAT